MPMINWERYIVKELFIVLAIFNIILTEIEIYLAYITATLSCSILYLTFALLLGYQAWLNFKCYIKHLKRDIALDKIYIDIKLELDNMFNEARHEAASTIDRYKSQIIEATKHV